MIPSPRWQGDARRPRRTFVYLLRSLQDGTTYLGWMTDVRRRLAAHNRGATPSTRQKRPWRLIGYEEYPSAAAAKGRERALKRSSRMRAQFARRVALAGAQTACGGLSEVGG